jgi:phenylalanyl-tRNA synthetase alpha chain
MNYKEEIRKCRSVDAVEQIRQKLFGKKGYFPLQFAKLKTLSNDEKKTFASIINKEKEEAIKLIEEKRSFCIALSLKID